MSFLAEPTKKFRVASDSTWFEYITKNAVMNLMASQKLSSVRVASASNLTATYANGSSGVGATLTNSGSMVAITIDGVALAANDRVLVTGQTIGFQNGIYKVTTVGTGAVAWVLTRDTDLDTPNQFVVGVDVLVREGTSYGSSLWYNDGVVSAVGTTSVVFKILSKVGILSISSANSSRLTATTTNNVTTLDLAVNPFLSNSNYLRLLAVTTAALGSAALLDGAIAFTTD